MSSLDDIVIQPMEDVAKAGAATASSDVKQVQIRFKPSPSAPHLPVAPETSFSVPVNLARLGLSELLNHVLAQKPARPFEFLISNRFLRTSLERYLTVNGLSGEAELQLEYIEALPPPEKDTSTPHPDWIADVDARVGAGFALLPLPAAQPDAADAKKGKKAVPAAAATAGLVSAQPATFSVTGCFDGVVRVWAHPADSAAAADAAAAPACVLAGMGAGHLAPVKAVRVLRPTLHDAAAVAAAASVGAAEGQLALDAASALLVSASQDHSLRVWEFASPAAPAAGADAAAAALGQRPRAPRPLACRAVCDFHTGTVECVETLLTAAQASGAGLSLAGRVAAPRFVSGGFEGSIGVWTLSNDYLIDEDEVAAQVALVKKSMGRQNGPRRLTPGVALVTGAEDGTGDDAGAAGDKKGGKASKRARTANDDASGDDDDDEDAEEKGDSVSALKKTPYASVAHYRPASAFVGGHKSAVTTLCWPHAQHLYSGSLDCTVKHWDLAQVRS